MSQKTFWQIQYFGLCINEFARKFHMSPQLAHNYLKQYKGLEFLQDNYEVEHTLALHDTINSLRKVCSYNGGTL